MAIISHKFKFIFVKNVKTAGTAIEVSSSPLCGPGDIFTPIIPAEPGHEPRNYAANDGDFYNHMPASEIRAKIGADRFNSYFKFCVERDPVDKCLSHFAMLKNSPSHQNAQNPNSWEEYVERGRFPVDESKYRDRDGALLVDRILDYGRLETELADVMASLNVPWTGLTSRAKAGFRTANIPKPSAVTDAQRLTILKAFAPKGC